MKAVVVGYQQINYTRKKDGKQVEGISLFIEREPTDREQGVHGLVTSNIFISADSQLFRNLPQFQFGKSYDFVYDYDGRYSYLSGVVEVD